MFASDFDEDGLKNENKMVAGSTRDNYLRQEDVNHFTQNTTDFVDGRGSSFADCPKKTVLSRITITEINTD